MNIAIIIILAITIEALVEYVKELIKGEMRWAQIGAIAAAVFLAVAAGADMYVMLGVDFKIPVVGMVLTGILLSRGANYISDFMGKIQKTSVEG